MKNLCAVNLIVIAFCVSPAALGRQKDVKKDAKKDVKSVMTNDVPAISTVAPRTPAAIEETIVQLVEEGRIKEAQAEAKGSGLTNDRLTRVTGILLYGVGESGEALSYLRRAHQDAPSDPRIALYLADVLCTKKDFASARSLVDGVSSTALAGQPRPWEPTFRKAKLLSWQREMAAAKALYSSILTMPGATPTFVTDARVGLAEIASWQKDFDGAMRLLKPVFASSPGHVEATLIRGQVLEWQEKYKDAKAVYDAALQVHPDDVHLRWRLEKLSWVK
jgi:tetratricopeptide (TPR) repeat protein